jgi:hypothetical protein
MDKFFAQKTCDRCGDDLNGGRIMSMLNTDCICMKCSKEERQDKDYDKAVEADHEQIKKGNYNYKGIRGDK